MKRLSIILTICITAINMLISCNDDGFEYSDYHCNLTIDNSKHRDATLASAMNAMTPGIFCKISFKMENGAKYFVFENNHNTKTQSIFNAIDEKLQNEKRLGQYNGVIVGYGNLDNPAKFYAYDGQCPNCFNPNSIPLKDAPLTVSSQKWSVRHIVFNLFCSAYPSIRSFVCSGSLEHSDIFECMCKSLSMMYFIIITSASIVSLIIRIL